MIEFSSITSVLPCIDECLPKKFSCKVCGGILYEPCTTPCGHNFCRKCLQSSIYMYGRKCPICSQLISNGKSCTVNAVLWNTIQHLFPQEVEERKATEALNSSWNLIRELPSSSDFEDGLLIGAAIGAGMGFTLGLCIAIVASVERR